jgi:hypothetical protein
MLLEEQHMGSRFKFLAISAGSGHNVPPPPFM